MVNDKFIKSQNSIKVLRQQNSRDRAAAASSRGVLFIGMGLLTLSGLLGIVYSAVSGVFERKNAAKEKKRIDDEMEEMRAEIVCMLEILRWRTRWSLVLSLSIICSKPIMNTCIHVQYLIEDWNVA
jgi:hypothetical protein